ncbi:MmyB family transcriptional regulator [Roseomonas marmotae]|nr:helix-turn-helix domain-containing protein [Roseomonas marmotae]
MSITQPTVGDLLREWRLRRRRSQLDLALDAEVSTRHLSYVETGRASASREMLLRLAEHLGMPLRQRNQLLMAGGFAPHYPERPLQAPDMAAARGAVEAILKGHEPFPALAVDRHWHLLAANDAVAPLLAGAAPELLAPPVNVLRLSLHPRGLAPWIENLPEWRAHLLERLRAQIDQSGDPVLAALHVELSAYPCPPAGQAEPMGGIAVPLRIRPPGQDRALSFLSTTTVFGTPVDVTLSELALECFYPADEATRRALTATVRTEPSS